MPLSLQSGCTQHHRRQTSNESPKQTDRGSGVLMKRKASSLLLSFLLSAMLIQPACKSEQQSAATSNGQQAAPPGSLELVFTYGSEKEAWIKDVTTQFNNSGQKSSSGKKIFVTAIPMGSGDAIDEVLLGRRQSHIV